MTRLVITACLLLFALAISCGSETKVRIKVPHEVHASDAPGPGAPTEGIEAEPFGWRMWAALIGALLAVLEGIRRYLWGGVEGDDF